MTTELACMLCSIDPGTANLVVPIAQATIISVPFLMRDQIRRGAGYLLARRGSDPSVPEELAIEGVVDEEVDPEP